MPYASPSLRALLLAASSLAATACIPRGDPSLGAAFVDDFERTDIGAAWNNTGGPYEISDGKLHIRGARNKPLWLRRRLPHDVRIELDVRSDSPEGDIKLEVFGDGVSKAVQASYTATSYVVVFGGWGNSKNIIARMDEHGADRVEGPARRVTQGHTYRMKIERKGDTITAWADGVELAKLKDSEPLHGPGHDHFAINNWQSDLWFDNLKITPL
jgi:hypothetical protein